MNLNDFDALSFDCYGTLIDWEDGLRGGLMKVAALAPTATDVDALLETYGEAEARIEREQPAMRYPEIIARSITATGAAHGIEVPETLAAEIGASVPQWPAFPDSAEALRRLKQRYKLIILSNVDRQSFAGSHERLGMEFDAVLTAEDVGSYKPNPRNFEALLAKVDEMGIAKDRLLHVAQSLFHDHVPAKVAGLATVWIDRRAGKEGGGATPIPADAPEPDWRFNSMAQFADAVERTDDE
jgi:putative hydrolase of the HAD superfamily